MLWTPAPPPSPSHRTPQGAHNTAPAKIKHRIEISLDKKGGVEGTEGVDD
jgi:hypothetical protein